MSETRNLDPNDLEVQRAVEVLGLDVLPGEVARVVRIARGLSLKEVAARLGGKTHFTTVAKLETGKTRFNYEWANNLARALSVPSNVFLMPYDAFRSGSRIPVYTSIEQAALFPQGVPNTYDFYYGADSGVLGFCLLGPPDLYSEINLITALVDTTRREPRDGGAYLISGERFENGFVGIYRADGLPRLIAWPVPSSDLITLDPEMVVLGEVIELRRQLISRNR